MIRVALRGLAGRKIRGALTALSIVLGVALVSGAFVMGDTLKQAADSLENEAYRGIDGVVTGRSLVETEEWTQTPPISERLLARCWHVFAQCRRSATRSGACSTRRS